MKSLFGGILLAAGILIAGVSGVCSLVILGLGVTEPSGIADVLPMVLLVGGIPFLIGLGLFFLGRAVIRGARRDRQETAAREPNQP